MSEPSIRGPLETKNRQKIVAISVFGGFLMIVMLALWISDPNKNKPKQEYVSERGRLTKDYRAVPSSGVSDEENWIMRSEEDLEALRQDAQQKDAQIEKLLARLEQLEKARSEDLGLLQQQADESLERDARAMDDINKLLEQTKTVQGTPVQPVKTLDKPLPPPPRVSVSGPQVSNKINQPAKPAPGFQHISLTLPQSARDAKKSALEKNISRYLPTGTLSKGVFITGVDAPTGGSAQSNPHPVLIRVKSFGNLPNFAQSYIKDCHVLGAATGNISSERVEVRLETLTCILKDGDIIEVPVKGYVTGEDGKMGMRGRVVEKQGQLIARALVAGGLGGISGAVSQQNRTFSTSALGSTSTYDPDKIGEAGAAEGFSTALDKLSDYYFKRLNEMYPVIEMDAGRICDLILTGGTDLEHKIIGNTHEAWN